MAPSKSNTRTSTLTVLKLITKFVSSMSASDLDALVSGQARLVLVYSRDENELKSVEVSTKVTALQDIIDDLKAAETTEAAFRVVERASLNRTEIERMARSIDVAVRKEDTVARLVEKVVEALVGSRLNSRAVRGHS